MDAATDDAGDAVAAFPPAACIESPPALPGPRSIVTVMVDVVYMGKPVVYGEAFGLPNGGALTISNFRFFLSDFLVLRRGQPSIPVDIVASDGTPVPYNVHLANAESASEMTFRIAVPAGDYTGMTFLFGINDACDGREPSVSKPPLTFQSQMTWPPPFGFLFLRYEGMVTGATGPDAPLSALAMGGLRGTITAPRIEANGALHVTNAPAGDTSHLRVALDEIFKAASLPLDPNAIAFPMVPPGPGRPDGPPGTTEIEAGDHLRQNATKVSIFSVVAE